MAFDKGKLVAGLGRNAAGDAEAWEWNGGSWLKIGGDGVNSGWTGYYSLESMIAYNNMLCTGMGLNVGNAVLWCWNGSDWSQVGGDEVNGSWAAGTYEKTKTLAVYDGKLYAGLGNSTGDGEVWTWDSNVWTKIGGSGINSGWAGTIEEVESFSPYKGKLYVGTGTTANADAAVWSWGNNGFLQSSVDHFDTSWHHVAATYDGNTMKLYVDGTLEASANKSITVASNDLPLLLGAGYGGREYGKPQARFKGQLDEIRLSNIARTSFTSSPYSSDLETVSPVDSVRKSGVWHWDSLTPTQSPSGGTVTFRLSNDDGTTWKYWMVPHGLLQTLQRFLTRPLW